MDNNRYRYEVRLPLSGKTPDEYASGIGYHTVAVALTPEGAADVVRALCSHPSPEYDHIRVEVRHQL